MNVLPRAKLLISQLGWANAGLYALNKTLRALSGERVRLYKYYLVAQPVPATGIVKKPTGNTLIRKIQAGDPQTQLFPRPQWVIEDRYQQGAHCLAAYNKHGELAGYIWLILHRYKEDEVRCNFTPLPVGKCAWDFDVHVAPSYRMGRTFARLWDVANEFLRSQGYQWTLSRISAFNPGSFTAHSSMGSRIMGSALFVCIGEGQLLLSTMPPYVHFSIRAYPEIQLNPLDFSKAR